MSPFDGDTYERNRDQGRLLPQLERVKLAMASGRWWTLPELAAAAEAPEASVSARIRDLRKAKFGGYEIEAEYLEAGLWRYRMVVEEQAELFR